MHFKSNEANQSAALASYFYIDGTKQSGSLQRTLTNESTHMFTEGVSLTDQYRDYLLPHFSMIIVGKPGSGKTSLVRALVTDRNYYYKKFDTIIIISPSANKMGIPVKKYNMNYVLDLRWLEKRLLEINYQQVRDIIKELKRDDKIRAFYKDEETPIMQQIGEIKTKGQQVVRYPSKQISKDRNKLISEDLVSGYYGQSQHSKAPAILPQTTSTNGGKDVPLLYYIDDMHMKYVKGMTNEERAATYKNVLIVMDDVVATIKANEHNPLLAQLFFNRRHLIVNGMISIVVVSQKYTMIPVRIRSNVNWLVLYRLNPIDFENVYKDVVLMNQQQWKDLLYYIYGSLFGSAPGGKTHDTLGIWVEHDIFFKNFYRLKINDIN